MLRGANYTEYLNALANAKLHIDAALRATDGAVARRAIADAKAELAIADTRVSHLAGPPA